MANPGYWTAGGQIRLKGLTELGQATAGRAVAVEPADKASPCLRGRTARVDRKNGWTFRVTYQIPKDTAPRRHVCEFTLTCRFHE